MSSSLARHDLQREHQSAGHVPDADGLSRTKPVSIHHQSTKLGGSEILELTA